MFPILYESITTGIIPQHNGLGILSDASSVICDREANSIYELTFDYPISGKHAQDLAYRRVVKAKPNFTDEPQLFRIDRIGKVMNGKFTVYCKHISYDLSGFDIVSGNATSAVGACLLLQNAAPGYSITTDKNVSANFKIGTPGSVKSYFLGREGSFLDVFGKAEIKYDNFSVRLLQNAGQNRGVTIRYQKNLLELSQEIGSANLYTHVRCFYKDTDGNITNSSKISTGLLLDVDRCLIVDVSDEFETTPTVSQLDQRAISYKNENNLTVPTNNITLDFVQSGELRNRVDLFDTVNVYYEALGITRAEVKCIRTKYDVIREKYIEVEFGDAKFDVSDTIINTTKTLADKPSTSFMADAIAHATELITGNLGGYVILHDSNGDGEPDEILIMNTPDIATATQIWRWNKNGLGFATSYEGPYGTAITQDGQIVANFITTGTLNANLIKAGVISDINGNSTIDMATGVATMKNFRARLSLSLVDASNIVRGSMGYTDAKGTDLRLTNPDGVPTVILQAKGQGNGGLIFVYNNNGDVVGVLQSVSTGGSLRIYNTDGDQTFLLQSDEDGGLLRIRNNANNLALQLACTSEGGGTEYLMDDTNVLTIQIVGQTGNITCVSLTQTSSKKNKENIRPIEDAAKILELEAVAFDFKDKTKGTDKRGFIAEDVAEILPNLVTPETEEAPASLDYIGMIPYLQDVIKKQQKRIDELESKLDAIIEKNGG
jgi:phage minor structural protein